MNHFRMRPSSIFFPALLGALFLVFPLKSFSAVIPNIIVDQFGYRNSANKLVIFAKPVSGVGIPSSFAPGATFNVINVSGGATVFTGSVSQWSGGAVHAQSGDMAWQGDFSAVTTTGTYVISMAGGSNPGDTSYHFQIRPDVFNGVVTVSQRMYFYQRCGDNLPAANGGNWYHTACHEGSGQDLAAHLWDNGADQGAGTARDVHGGWHDAGDYGKYVTFAHATLWYLLHSVEWFPTGYTDATNIPESGNGVPDMLDEVKWELDWMLRMQRADGALYSMVGQTNVAANNQGNPANDTAPRYYTNVSTTATATGAMAFALGARILGQYPLYASYAVTLQNAAVSAWGYLQANPSPVTFNATGVTSANANQSAGWDAEARVGAAAELFALTGGAAYRTYFDSNYNSAAVTDNGGFLPVSNPPNASSNSFDPSLAEPLELGMVSYGLAPGATAAVVNAIEAAIKNECEWNILPNNPGQDPYMGYMYTGHYTWGSNQLKASWGNQLLFAQKLGVYPAHSQAYLNQAEEYLHYFHGRNPLNYVFLTNTGTKGANLGASQPIMSIFHSWFWNGTTYDGNSGPTAIGPAPGYLSGGPNQDFAPDASYGSAISPPQNEPPMKSYKDWGTTWPQDSWEVTEPDQGYQGKYQFLLSAFAASVSMTATFTPTPSASSTATKSPTPTMTATVTPTVTAALTPTPTFSPAITASPTATMTPVPGATATLTPTVTAVPTSTRTPIFTATFSSTPTLSPTAVMATSIPTPPAVSGPVLSPVIYPNPVHDAGPVKIRLPAYAGSTNVRVQIFTVALRRVQDRIYPNAAGNTDLSLNLVDVSEVSLANGLYYLAITTPVGRSIQKLLILR